MLRVVIYNNGRILDIEAEEIKYGKRKICFFDKDV